MNKFKEKEKEKKVIECLNEPYVNLWHLKELALSEYGFVNDELRQRAWPLLTGIDITNIPKKYSKFMPNSSNIPCSEEMEQVHRDVIRIPTSTLLKTSISKVDSCNIDNKGSLVVQRERLKEIINITLQEGNGKLYYYQGFHDIATIFLNVLTAPNNDNKNIDDEVILPKINDISIASSVLYKTSSTHLNLFMEKDFNSLLDIMTFTIAPMIFILDTALYNHLFQCGTFTNNIPFFTLSWIITWFSHDMNDSDYNKNKNGNNNIDTVKRLFDVMISSHPIFIIYMVIAMLLHPHNRNLILTTGVVDSSTNNDSDDCFALMHNLLCSLPKQSCSFTSDDDTDNNDNNANVNIQELIDTAILFMRIIPPRNITSIARYYKNGALFKNDDKENNNNFMLLSSSSMLQFPSIIDSKVSVSSEIPSDWYRYKRKLLHEKTSDLIDEDHDDKMTSSSENITIKNSCFSSLRKRKTLTYSEDSNAAPGRNDDNTLDTLDKEKYNHSLKIDDKNNYQNAMTTSAYNPCAKRISSSTIILIIPNFIISIIQKYSPSSYYYHHYYYYYYVLVFFNKKHSSLHNKIKDISTSTSPLLIYAITTTTTATIFSMMTLSYYYYYIICTPTIIVPTTTASNKILDTSVLYNKSLFINLLFFTTTTTTATWLWSWWR